MQPSWFIQQHKVSAHRSQEIQTAFPDRSSVSVLRCDVDWDGKQTRYLGGTLSITAVASWSSRSHGVLRSWIIPCSSRWLCPPSVCMSSLSMALWHSDGVNYLWSSSSPALLDWAVLFKCVCECAFLSVCTVSSAVVWEYFPPFAASFLYNDELFIN